MSKIIVPILEVKQPVGSFYLGVIEARDLVAISFSDIRRTDGRDLERYIGIQRDLSEGRVSEIKKYVKNVDACFPTGIILAISNEHVELTTTTEGFPALAVNRASDIAKIIDGQHRIAGFEGFEGEPFYLNVTIFIDMELEDQAMIFATINLKQTKVTKSLASDLYEFAEARSPQKTGHNIARLMNFKQGSPLKHFIKILGKSTGQELESITQSTFVDRLMKLISREPMQDKDLIKRKRTPARAISVDEQRKLLFRNLFIDEKDAQITMVLWEYFSAVKERWPVAWVDRSKGAILGRSTGFAALLRLLPEVVVRITASPLDRDSSIIDKGEFLAILNLIRINDDEFVSIKYLPGSSGEGKLFTDMLSYIEGKPKRW
ncbi:MAG: DGQHR domain-containing protein [Sideroxyarcus sp.]|nr:DGQHR domain-containing protein [Sideroxyarcus sp.]